MLASPGKRAVVLLTAMTLSACGEESRYEPSNVDSTYIPPAGRAVHAAGPRVPLPQGTGLVLLNISVPSTRAQTSSTDMSSVSPNAPSTR